jgi:hypothetical protein
MMFLTSYGVFLSPRLSDSSHAMPFGYMDLRTLNAIFYVPNKTRGEFFQNPLALFTSKAFLVYHRYKAFYLFPDPNNVLLPEMSPQVTLVILEYEVIAAFQTKLDNISEPSLICFTS